MTHIDWLSFTIPLAGGGIDLSGDDGLNFFLGIVSGGHYPALSNALAGAQFASAPARKGYTGAIVDGVTGIRVYGAKKQSHILIECSGGVCAILAQREMLFPLVEEFSDRCSRIDLAHDLDTAETPLAFIEHAKGKRLSTRGHIVSATGQTVYVGSRTSERMLRVYRYAYPHERSHLLRLEVECKGDLAKSVALGITTEGVPSVTRTLHERYKWDIPIDFEQGQLIDLSARRRTASDFASWLRWVEKQVTPSLVDAAQHDGFNLEGWAKELLAKVYPDKYPSEFPF